MKNKEKYAKEIIKIACDWYNIAVNKNTGKPEKCCLSLNCTECLFSRDNGSCNSSEKRREWAESEYIEKPVISKKDRAFLEYIHKSFKSIARDKDRKIYMFTDIAKKDKNVGAFTTDGLYRNVSNCFDIDFPMVKWEDDGPWLIEDLKKLEVVEDYE